KAAKRRREMSRQSRAGRKAAEDRRSPRRRVFAGDWRTTRSVVECASALALFGRRRTVAGGWLGRSRPSRPRITSRSETLSHMRQSFGRRVRGSDLAFERGFLRQHARAAKEVPVGRKKISPRHRRALEEKRRRAAAVQDAERLRTTCEPREASWGAPGLRAPTRSGRRHTVAGGWLRRSQ